MAARTFYVVELSWHDDSQEGWQERRDAFTSKQKAIQHFNKVFRESDHNDVVRLVRHELLDLPPKEVFRRLLERRHYAEKVEELRNKTIPYRGPPKQLVAQVEMELNLLGDDASDRDRWDTATDIVQDEHSVETPLFEIYDLTVEILGCLQLKHIAMNRDEFIGNEPTGTTP